MTITKIRQKLSLQRMKISFRKASNFISAGAVTMLLLTTQAHAGTGGGTDT